MTVNKELLHETMDAVLANPDLHNQANWAIATDCGTAYCFAGWACKLMGHEADREHLLLDGVASSTEDGYDIQNLATDLLGLDWYSAEQLFAEKNTTTDLKHLVDEIAEHGKVRGDQPGDPWEGTPLGFETNGASS